MPLTIQEDRPDPNPWRCLRCIYLHLPGDRCPTIGVFGVQMEWLKAWGTN